MIAAPTIPMTIDLAVGSHHDDELDQATRALLRELDELGVDAQLAPAAQARAGAKGDVVTCGAILLAVLPVAVPKLLDFLNSWISRDRERRATLKIDCGGKSIELCLAGRSANKADTAALLAAAARLSAAAAQP